MEFLQAYLQNSLSHLSSLNLIEVSTTASTSFLLISAAEIGDKSQLVCMALAARHRAMPILLGAIVAFALLNSLAVMFGSAIAGWLPDYWVSAIVALLFTIFGIHALFIQEQEEDEQLEEKSSHNLFLTTFVFIVVAEFGDKTQLAVVALSSTFLPIAVWLGATAALAFTSALGVLAGRTVLQKCSVVFLHKLSGTMFIILGSFAAYKTYVNYHSTQFILG